MQLRHSTIVASYLQKHRVQYLQRRGLLSSRLRVMSSTHLYMLAGAEDAHMEPIYGNVERTKHHDPSPAAIPSGKRVPSASAAVRNLLGA